MADGSTDILLGAIAGAHGVRGEVRVKTFTEDPGAIGDYGPVHTEDGRVFSLRVTKPVKGGMAAKLDGVTDRDQAEALKGTRLYVSRDALGEPGVQCLELLGDLRVRLVRGHAGGLLGRVARDHGAPDGWCTGLGAVP
mgnify:CR=1 FL=1